MIEFSLLGLFIYTSFAVIVGFMTCAILATGKKADEAMEHLTVTDYGITDRDKKIKDLEILIESKNRTIHNQGLKINELLKVNSEMHDTINQIDDSKIIKIMRSN